MDIPRDGAGQECDQIGHLLRREIGLQELWHLRALVADQFLKVRTQDNTQLAVQVGQRDVIWSDGDESPPTSPTWRPSAEKRRILNYAAADRHVLLCLPPIRLRRNRPQRPFAAEWKSQYPAVVSPESPKHQLASGSKSLLDSDRQVSAMRWWMAAALMAPLCAACSLPNARHSLADRPKINWEWQKHVLESRQAWDEATGRKDQYEELGIQLAR